MTESVPRASESPRTIHRYEETRPLMAAKMPKALFKRGSVPTNPDSPGEHGPAEDARQATDALDGLGDLYHEYSFFGVRNRQIPGIYADNQKAKAPTITAHIARAIALAKDRARDPTCMELFCADGYYAMVASRLGASQVYGVDNGRDGHTVAGREIARRLNIDNMEYIDVDLSDVHRPGTLPKTEIVLNVGGLYHVSNPREVLEESYALANSYLIVQSVVSTANNSANYFEAPAPGWDWGSRFSRASFERMVEDLGYYVIDRHFNELMGNERLEDRGSIYYLIEK